MIGTFELAYQIFWIMLALFGAGFVLAIIWSVHLHWEEKKQNE